MGPKCEQLKIYFPESSEETKEQSQKTKEQSIKSTFKIEINDEEKKVRDKQQTTVYHTGAVIELDEEDRKEIERERMADIDE